MNGLTEIRRAEWSLDGPDDYRPPRDGVLAAFAHVWSALECAQSWPDGLRAQAAGLIVAMLRHGTRFETAERMTDAEVRDFTAMLRRFVADAERAELAESVTALRRRTLSTPVVQSRPARSARGVPGSDLAPKSRHMRRI